MKIGIHRKISLHFFCVGVKRGQFTLKEVYELQVFGNYVLRKIFGPKKDDVREHFRTLHDQELRDFYRSSIIVKVVTCRKLCRSAYKIFVGRLLEKSTRKIEKDIGGEHLDEP
jgi:hypothetical protein